MSKDLTKLCVETATAYFRGDFLLQLLRIVYEDAYDDMEAQDLLEAAKDDILVSCNLRAGISTSTACNWLRYLGYKYGAHKKIYYTNRHETQENKDARVKYAATVGRNEIRKYKWVRLNQEQKAVLESLEKHPLQKDSHTRTYQNNTIYEYHVSLHPMLQDFVSEENQIHGGDLSLAMPAGSQPIIEVGQDEAIFYQNSLSAMEWSGPNGESTPRPKSDGDGIMVSAFIGPSIGFGCNTQVDNEALARINHIRQNVRPDYLDVPSATEVHGRTKKKLFQSEKEVQAVLCVTFVYGKNKDGHWNNAYMAVQTEDAVDVLQGMFPNHDLELHYDQSSGHTKKRRDGLDMSNMNKGWGGAQPSMRDTVLTEVGTYDHPSRLRVGDVQSVQSRTQIKAQG